MASRVYEGTSSTVTLPSIPTASSVTVTRNGEEDDEVRDKASHESSVVESSFSNNDAEIASMIEKVAAFKECLDSETSLLHDLARSVDELKDITDHQCMKKAPKSSDSKEIPKELPPITDLEMMNYLHKIHASCVPDHRKSLIADLSRKFIITSRQLGEVLAQLRYLAEKEFAITVLVRDVVDPENYADLLCQLDNESMEDRETLMGTMVRTISYDIS